MIIWKTEAKYPNHWIMSNFAAHIQHILSMFLQKNMCKCSQVTVYMCLMIQFVYASVLHLLYYCPPLCDIKTPCMTSTWTCASELSQIQAVIYLQWGQMETGDFHRDVIDGLHSGLQETKRLSQLGLKEESMFTWGKSSFYKMIMFWEPLQANVCLSAWCVVSC